MKYLFAIICFSILPVLQLTAQVKSTGKMQATVHKTFTMEKEGTLHQYNIKVLEHRDYPMEWEGNDPGTINQDREDVAAKVTKLIAVDMDNDNQYEQYFVLTYRKSVTDEFKLVATKNGFAVKVDNKTMQYFAKDGIYFIENKDQDFFIVDEFREVG